MDYVEVLSAFGSHQRARGLAEKTIERRRYSLRSLAVFATPVPLLMVTADLIEDWLNGYPSAETKHAYLADTRALFHWARRRALAAVDPTEDMDPVRRPKPLPRPIPETELIEALAAADDRTRLVLLLGSLAGLRRSEIARLRGEDCTERHIVVRTGKGAKDRVMPMHPYLWTTVRSYGRHTGWIFPAASGTTHVQPSTIGAWVRLHFRRLDIARTLHSTRHAYGTNLAEISKGNLLAVRDLMGHADVSTTQRYIAFDQSGLAALVNQLRAG
jgi:integrase